MDIYEIEQLQKAGLSLQQIQQIEDKTSKQSGFRALIHMALCLLDYGVPFSDLEEAWQIALMTRKKEATNDTT